MCDATRAALLGSNRLRDKVSTGAWKARIKVTEIIDVNEFLDELLTFIFMSCFQRGFNFSGFGKLGTRIPGTSESVA